MRRLVMVPLALMIGVLLWLVQDSMRLGFPDLWALVLVAVGTFLLWLLARRVAEPEDVGFLTGVVVATIAVRAAWAFAQHTILADPESALTQLSGMRVFAFSPFHTDGPGNYVRGARIAAEWKAGTSTPPLPETLGEFQVWAIRIKTALLCYIFGPSIWLGEAVAIVSNSSICIAIYMICRHIRVTRLATRMAVLLTAFLPSIVFWSTQDLKDPITATCAAWILLGLFRAFDRSSNALYLLLLAAMSLVGMLYRPYVGILLIVGELLALAHCVRLPASSMGKLLRAGLFLSLAPLGLWFGVKEMQAAYGEEMGVGWAVGQYQFFRARAIEKGSGGSEYVIPLEARSPTAAILQLPLRIVLLLLSPIPIIPGSMRRMMAYPEMWFLYLFAVPRFVRGIREAIRKNRRALVVVLLFVAPTILAYALKTAVSGEAIRMRTQFLPELLILVGIGHAVTIRDRRASSLVQGTPGRGVDARSATPGSKELHPTPDPRS